MRGNPGKVIDRLREAGWRVTVIHGRERNRYGTILPNGGATLVQLQRGDTYASGLAQVHPQDNFDRRRGLRIALGRAMVDAAHGHRGESQRMILFGQVRDAEGHVVAAVTANMDDFRPTYRETPAASTFGPLAKPADRAVRPAFNELERARRARMLGAGI